MTQYWKLLKAFKIRGCFGSHAAQKVTAHREDMPSKTYNSSLTDAEWTHRNFFWGRVLFFGTLNL